MANAARHHRNGALETHALMAELVVTMVAASTVHVHKVTVVMVANMSTRPVLMCVAMVPRAMR